MKGKTHLLITQHLGVVNGSEDVQNLLEEGLTESRGASRKVNALV